MAKFATYMDVAIGVEARRIVELRTIGMHASKPSIKVALVPLLFGADSDALEAARDYAKARKVVDPKPGDPLYERGLMLHTVLLAAVDVDSPLDKPEPFFANEQEITKHLDPDRVSVLFHQQREWQAAISPLPKQMDPGTYIATLAAQMRAPEAADIPFDALPLEMRRSFLAQSAHLLSAQPQLKSLFGLFSADDEQSSPNTANPGAAAAPPPSPSKSESPRPVSSSKARTPKPSKPAKSRTKRGRK